MFCIFGNESGLIYKYNTAHCNFGVVPNKTGYCIGLRTKENVTQKEEKDL